MGYVYSVLRMDRSDCLDVRSRRVLLLFGRIICDLALLDASLSTCRDSNDGVRCTGWPYGSAGTSSANRWTAASLALRSYAVQVCGGEEAHGVCV